MRKELVHIVMAAGVYDTRKYRYIYDQRTDRILRIRLDYPEEWEEV